VDRRTDQEEFWEGDFGDEYVARNAGGRLTAANVALFGNVLRRTADVRAVLELGCNVGLNLRAIRSLLPDARLSAVEINRKAADLVAERMPDVELTRGSILEFAPDSQWDLVFTKGVLIHINPDELHAVYDLMYKASSRYLMVSEYYNPRPVEIDYRGHSAKLFKRDFAGEMLDRLPGLRLVDYGFAYHRDSNFPQDDTTWFLMEKV